jgi:hypothetical protein
MKQIELAYINALLADASYVKVANGLVDSEMKCTTVAVR